MPSKSTLYILDIKRGVHDKKSEEYKKRLRKELDEGILTKKEYNEIIDAYNDRLKKIKGIK